MECRAAFKSSTFFSQGEVVTSSSGPYLADNIWSCLGGINGAASAAATTAAAFAADEFPIEDYFDISAAEEFEFEEEEEEDDEEKRSSSSSSSSSCSASASVSASLSPLDGLASELSIPVVTADDVKELETWAHLMDDSSIPDPEEIILPAYHPINFKPDPVRPIYSSSSSSSNPTTTPPGFPVKPRTSRARKPGSAWNQSQHLIITPEPEPEQSFIFIPNPTTPIYRAESMNEPPLPAKKKQKQKQTQKRRQQQLSPAADGSTTTIRRCTHCQVQKTPQWRTGPLGPKTLCNACGVRFKSGRLFPEYRPACSPTFLSEVHSNSHRKVLEMRKKKENGEPADDDYHATIITTTTTTCPPAC